jgi:hypothetical protein
METKKIFSNPLAIFRGIALFFIYSLISFFYFHYSSHASDGHAIEFFDIDLSSYVFYFVICIIISIRMGLSLSFNKEILRAFEILLVLELVAWFIPVGFGSYGMAFLPALIIILILFAISFVIYNITKLFQDNNQLTTITLIVLFLLLCLVVYANYNDLSVKQKIIYKNNSMFDSLEECNAYIYFTREKDCKNDWTAMHNRWNLQEQTRNINLNANLSLVSGSENYQYFPSENILDIKIGSGQVAKYNDVATVKILNALVNGKTYDQASTISTGWFGKTGGEYQLNLNTGVEEYNSYALGIIGMKVGGIRKITFKTSRGFWFSNEEGILVNKNEPVSYTVELVSLDKK